MDIPKHNSYLVTIVELEDEIYRNVFFETEEDLSLFLKYFDTTKYMIVEINVVNSLLKDSKELYKKDNNLEKGENNVN